MKSDRSLFYRVGIFFLVLLSLVVIAMPADSYYRSFSESVEKTLERDVSKVSFIYLPATEGASLFFPEKIEQLLVFSVPQSISNFIFPRDSNFAFKDGFFIISDSLGNELSRISLGDEAKILFDRTDLNVGTAFKVPKLDSSYFILALSGTTIRNFLVIGNSLGLEPGKYSSLAPVAIVSDPELASNVVSGDTYKTVGDLVNEVYSYIYSGDTISEGQRDVLLKSVDKATTNTALDPNIDDSIKNEILAVYASTSGLVGNGTKDQDGRYSNVLSGIQVELANRILRSNKTLGVNTQATPQAPRSLKASTGTLGQVTSGTSSQARSIATAGSASNSSTARATAIDPRSLTAISNLTMPAKAKVGSAVVLTPCEPTKGYITHFLQDRVCTGANIISIPMGVFSLIYNSSKPDDSFYGIQRAKTSYDEYITSDLKFYITARDQKIPLVKSGTSLNSSFVWGVSPFKASGAKYIREERKSGFKYVYAKAASTDTKYRLVEVQLIDNSKVIGLQYKSVSPFDLISIEYRPKREEKTLRKVNLNLGGMTYYGTEGIWLSVDYPDSEDVFKDVNITSFHGTLSSIMIGSAESYDFNNQGSVGKFFPVAVSYKKRLPDGEGDYKVNTFFGYDSDGTKVYEESNSFNKSGKKFVRSVDYTYPKSTSTHSVNFKDNFNKSGGSEYRSFGGNVLKVATITPFGNDILEYKAPLYSFYRQYSARDKKWGTEVLKFEDGAIDIRFKNQIKSETAANGTTTTIFKDLDNKEILKSVHTDKGNGEFSSTVVSGAIKQVDGKTNVVGTTNSFRETKLTEVAGKKANDVNTLVSDALVQINDLVKGSEYKEVKVGDKVTETFTEPNQPSYTKVTTSSTSNKIATTESTEKVGEKLVSKRVTKTVDEPTGASWLVDDFTPVEGSRTWRQYSSSYDATKKQSDSKESISPVGGK